VGEAGSRRKGALALALRTTRLLSMFARERRREGPSGLEVPRHAERSKLPAASSSIGEINRRLWRRPGVGLALAFETAGRPGYKLLPKGSLPASSLATEARFRR
jgi:hypothetical protein